MTKYKYKNVRHVKIMGIMPGEEKVLDHPIECGGCFRLIEEIAEKKTEPIKESVSRRSKK